MVDFGEHTAPGKVPSSSSSSNSTTVSFAKVFGIMFLGLLITAGIALGLAYPFYLLYRSDPYTLRNLFIGLSIGCGVVLIILTFVINGILLKGQHSILIPAIIYVVLMGVLLSTFVWGIPWQTLGLAFAITCGIFLILTIIALIAKGRVSGIAMCATMLFIGAGLVALFTWIFLLIWPQQMSYLFWILDFVIFGAVMLITIVDISHIQQICERGELSKDLALYCAFTIYVDFIYILVKVITYLAIATSRN